MKNLQRLYDETLKDIQALDIPYGIIRKVSVDMGNNKRWGQCRIIKRSPEEVLFSITISKKVLADNLDDMAAKNTIAHEILHTVRGCFNHGAMWKRYAKLLNSAFGYDIKRTTNSDEKGIAIEDAMVNAKYIITCTGCGVKTPYYRKSSIVSSIEQGQKSCRCARCKSKDFSITYIK